MNKTITKIRRGLLAAILAFGLTQASSAQTIFSESFTGTGIPAGWTNVATIGTTAFIRESDGTSNSGTTFAGTFTGPTVSNGYVLYDSDDNAKATGDNATLTTPAINCTGKSIVFLKFNEYYAHFNSTGVVSVSNNGTTWTDVHSVHTGLAANDDTNNPLAVNVDISSVAANQPTVYVRFKYTSTAAGGSYWWFIDDVEVYEGVAGAVDLTVQQIYTLGKLPLTGTSDPHQVQAVIKNNGPSMLASDTVFLSVTGATTFKDTVVINNLAANASTTVTFDGYTPTTAGNNVITVSVTNDMNNANNTSTYDQVVTANTISYAVGNPPTGTSLTGFGTATASAGFFVKYATNSSVKTTVPVVRALIAQAGPPALPTVGQTMYAVVLDGRGNLIGRSPNKVITTADLAPSGIGYISFPISTPPTLAPDTIFYVGLATIGGGYYPLITQPETPTRPNTFFTGGITGGTLAASTSTTTRFVIEADLMTAPTALTDAGIENVYSLGKVSLVQGGNISKVQARVKNNGTTTLTNVVVNAAITTSTYNRSVTVPTIAPGQSVLVNFPDYTANTPTNTKTLTISLPTADGNPNNNTMTSTITVTAATQGYAVGNTPETFVGFPNAGNSAFLVALNTTTDISVNTVRAFIRDDASVVGKTVFAVVVDSTGTEIGRSANVTLVPGDRGIMRPFTITPGAIVLGTKYYVGLVMPAYTGNRYFPLGVQYEVPQRSGAYYTWDVATSLKPEESEADFRYMIEADITNLTTGVNEELNSNLISVYPNPNNGIFNVSAKEMKGGNVAVEVRDLQGRVVFNSAVAKEAASLNLNTLAAGTYLIKVSTDQQIAVKRLVIQ